MHVRCLHNGKLAFPRLRWVASLGAGFAPLASHDDFGRLAGPLAGVSSTDAVVRAFRAPIRTCGISRWYLEWQYDHNGLRTGVVGYCRVRCSIALTVRHSDRRLTKVPNSHLPIELNSRLSLLTFVLRPRVFVL